MTEADAENLERLADAMGRPDIKGVTFIKAEGGRQYADSIRAALAEIDRLKAAHRETVNLIAWLDPARTRTAQYRQMAQDAGIPEDVP